MKSARDFVAPGTVAAVVEVTGQTALIAEGIELLRPGGRYQWVGMVHPDSRVELVGAVLIRKCLTIQGIHNYAPRHLVGAVDFLRQRGSSLPWVRLVSPPLPLESLDAAMVLARTGRWPRVAVETGA